MVCQVDNILVYGKDKHEHDKRLEAVLQKLEAGDFSKDRVKFLGHIIDASVIHPDRDKVKAIRSLHAGAKRFTECYVGYCQPTLQVLSLPDRTPSSILGHLSNSKTICLTRSSMSCPSGFSISVCV